MKIKYGIFILILVVVLLLTGIHSYQSYLRQRNLMINGINEKLFTAAMMARSILPENYHDDIVDSTSVSKDAFDNIVDQYNKLCVDLDLEYLWSLMKINGKIVFTSSTSPDKKQTNQKHAKFFELHSNPELYEEAFSSQKPQYQHNIDKWGEIQVALIPFTDINGRPYLFGASMKLSEVDALLTRSINESIYLGLGFLLAGLVLSYILSKLLSTQLNTLAIEAYSIVSGQLDKEVEEKGFYEQVLLARSFNKMILAIKEKMTALAKSEEKHRKLVSNISDVITIMDKEGIIKYKSSNIKEQFGWNPDELIGKHGLFTVHVDDKERIGKELTQLLKSDNASARVEYNYLCKDGSFKPVELTAVNRVKDPIINGVLANYKDITERKKSESQLKQSEEKYRTMIERSNDMIWTLDTTGNITFFNKQTEEVAGLKLEEWLGKSFVPLIMEEDLPLIMDIFQKGIEGQAAHYELRFKKQENEILTISVNTAPLSKDGVVSGLVSFGRDITEQKLAEKEKANLEIQLQQSQKMEAIGTLAGGIAHDFNNILGAIMGYGQLAQLNSQENPKVQKYIEQVCVASERAKSLVQQILAFSRQSKTEKIPVDIGVIVKEVLKLLRASLPSTIEIRHNVKSNMGTVKADQTQIHQTIMNLCTNAFHAMEKEGGQLNVVLTPVDVTIDDALDYQDIRPGRYLELTVTDTGHGMDAETSSRVFDPYFTTKEVGEGTGMGLSTVHGIVKEHGGDIKIDSESGVGTSCHVLFPLIEGQASQAAKAPQSLPVGNERILLVDDEESLTDIGKGLLESLGYTVKTRNSAHDALEAFRKQHDYFDMVITDLTMPKMTGEKLVQKIKEIRPDIPIILCSGFTMNILPEKVEELGIASVLPKPLDLEELGKKVRKALDKVKASNEES